MFVVSGRMNAGDGCGEVDAREEFELLAVSLQILAVFGCEEEIFGAGTTAVVREAGELTGGV